MKVDRPRRLAVLLLAFSVMAVLPPRPARAEQADPAPATDLLVEDMPNDNGQGLLITWKRSADDGAGLNNVAHYRILRGDDPFGDYDEADTVPAGVASYRDLFPQASDDDWYYVIESLGGPLPVRSETFGPVRAVPSWFNHDRFNVLAILVLVFVLIVIFLRRAARYGEKMYVRRIPGIDAIEEAIGRATEMGRPVLFVPGLGDMTNIQTIAAMLILRKVAETVANYQAKLLVPNCIPFVREVAADVVKQAYFNSDSPDDFDPNAITYLSQEQFAYTAGVNGMILREQPAAALYLGSFFAESLMLAETGYAAGAIQVAGTAEVTQLPFFIAACDYTLIGEELFAASAYLSKDERVLSTLKAADWAKVIFVALILLGAALETVGLHQFREFFTVVTTTLEGMAQ